jgi:hypothetical protein
MNDTTKILGFLAFIVFLVAVGPLLTIWSMNTLFPVLAIPYSIETWAAIILIKGLLTVQVTKK